MFDTPPDKVVKNGLKEIIKDIDNKNLSNEKKDKLIEEAYRLIPKDNGGKERAQEELAEITNDINKSSLSQDKKVQLINEAKRLLFEDIDN